MLQFAKTFSFHGRAFSTKVPLNTIGGSFSISADQALKSFQFWSMGFASSPVAVKSIRPVLLPFYSTNTKSCVYAGTLFSDNLVQALHVDSSHWTQIKINPDTPDMKKLLVDEWREVPASYSRTLLPGYQIEFTKSHTWGVHHAFVGAQTSRVSALKLYSFSNGMMEAIRFCFSRDSIVPSVVKVVMLLWWPILIQILLVSTLSWGTFRRSLSPLLTFYVDRALTSSATKPIAQWESQALHTLIKNQYAVFDPEVDSFHIQAQHAAQEFLHAFLRNQQQQQERENPRASEDFLRDLFRMRSAKDRQDDFFRKMHEEHQRRLDEEEQRQSRRSRFHRQQQQQHQQQHQGYDDFFRPQSSQQSPSDLHAILGVSRSASWEEIQTGYRKQLLKYHPDHFKGDEKVAQAKTQEIIDAFRALREEKKRTERASNN